MNALFKYLHEPYKKFAEFFFPFFPKSHYFLRSLFAKYLNDDIHI